MAIRGISFKIPQEKNSNIEDLLEGINVRAMFWYNVESQNEVWSVPQYTDFFKKEYYDGADFYQQIKVPHKVIFLKLQAYLREGKFVEIHKYEEFLTSHCVLLLLIYDCENVEIYSKDEALTRAICNTAHRNGYSEITLITDDNDGRRKMDIL